MTLRLSGPLLDEIRRHGEAAYPAECCGALVGRGDRVVAAVELPNMTEEGPRRRFLVRPSDYRLAERRDLRLDQDVAGVGADPDRELVGPEPGQPSLEPGQQRVDRRLHQPAVVDP